VLPPGTTADFGGSRGVNACAKAGLTEAGCLALRAREIAALAKLRILRAPDPHLATVANEAASLAGFFAKGPRIGGERLS
jgi:hypothetical protein